MSKKNKKQNKKSKNTVALPIMRIDWKDHFSANHQWEYWEEMDHTPKHLVSVGVKVHEDKDVITLAQNVSKSDRGADTTTILKSCIIRQTKLGDIEFLKPE